MFVSMTEYTLLALDNNKVPVQGVGNIHTRGPVQHLTAAGNFAATQPGTRFVRIATDIGIYVDVTGSENPAVSGDFVPPGGTALFEIVRGGTGVVVTVASTAAAVPTTGGGGGTSTALSDSLVVDAAGVYWILEDQGSGTFVYYKLSTLTVGTPTAPVTPAATSTGLQVVDQSYDVITAGTGYAVGDILEHVVILNIVTVPATISSSAWINITQGTVLAAAPTAANIVITPTTQAVTATDGGLVTIGTKADAAYAGGGGSATAIALYKGVYNLLAAALPAGTNVIGAVTQSGTWNVGLTSALPAGTNFLGSVGLGQSSTTENDISGTITAGGTAQSIQALTASRIGFEIQNNSTGDLWFSTKTTAIAGEPSFRIPPGQIYTTPDGKSPTGAISIIGATTGQTFSARTW